MFRRVIVTLCAAKAPEAASSGTPKPQPGVANHVPMHRNKFATKIAHFYMTKIPTGIREFVMIGPLVGITLLIIYNINSIVPGTMGNQMYGGTPQDVTTYELEPVYDEHGKLKAYRRINNKKTSV